MSSGFITEKEVAERRRARQEEWEKSRGEDDPLEPPEESHDPRCLYDRLQEQRQKKQDEYDEAHKFKNMVRGLEDDEVDFLELVDRSKLQQEIRVRTEENTAIAEYRKKVSEMQKNMAEEEIRAEMKAAEARKSSSSSKRTPSHLSLLAGAIKRKASEEEQTPASSTSTATSTSNSSSVKRKRTDESNEPSGENTNTLTSAASGGHVVARPGLQCIAVLPGLGVYTDSSDSDNNVDSDSDEEEDMQVQVPQQPRDITGRVVKPVAQCGGQQGC